MKKLTYILGICIALYSCTEKNNYQNDFLHIYDIHADSISTKTIYDHVYTTVVDSMYVVSSFQADPMLHFYSIPDLKYKFSFGTKGRAENEIQSFPNFCHALNGMLWIRGFTTNTLRRLTVQNYNATVGEKIILDLENIPNNMHLIRDSLLYYNDKDKYQINVYDTRKRKIINKVALSRNSKNDRNTTGNLCVNDTLVAYAYQYKHEIAFYRSSDMSPLRTVAWEYKNQDNLVRQGNSESTRLFYTGSVSTPSCMYFLCRDAIPHDSNARYYVESYNNACEPMYKYVLDKQIFSIAVDEKNGYIYGFGENDEYIYRFKLPKV